MEIGRRIYYDKTTGEVIVDTGERAGDVIEIPVEAEMTYYHALAGRTPDDTDVLELAYGERAAEFANKGSYKVDVVTQQLIIYPRLKLAADIQQIPADGQTAAIITATIQDDSETVIFKANNGPDYPVIPVDGMAIFEFASQIPGTYMVTASAGKFGSANLEVKVNA